MGLSPDAEAALRESLHKTFKEFDADGSGEIDTKEINDMMVSLGLLVQPDTLKAMMKEADADGSGEIDFEEFFAVMKKQVEDPSSGGAFAALVNRNQNSGPALKWRNDRLGKGCTINEEDARKVTKSGNGWGVQTLDAMIRTGTTKDAYDACDVLLECTKLSGDCYVGLVGGNFADVADVEPKSSKMAAMFNGADGEFYKKLQHLPLCKMCKLSSGDKVQIEIAMQKSEARLTVLDPANSIKASVAVGELFTSVTVGVGFGDGDYEVCLLGSSCEKTPVNEMDTNEVVSNEKKAAADATVGAAASLG